MTVPLLVPTTLYTIPPRLGRWLAVVEKRGGQVAILPDPEAPVAQESWIDPIPLLEKVIQGVRECGCSINRPNNTTPRSTIAIMEN